MPEMAPSGVRSSRPSTEPQRALLTPSASPSVGPPDRPPAKRPRHRSTPSSSTSAAPSMSNESTSSADFNSARRASTLRVLNSWAQLAERYNKRLDEDDIVDLYSGAIIEDRGVLKGAPRDYHIGHFAQPYGDQEYPDGDQDQEDSEPDDDDSELSALPPSETATDDDAPISKKELLRGVPPLSATTDAEDLKEFLEAEKRRRALLGDEKDDEEVSPEQLSTIREVLEEQARIMEIALANRAQDAVSAEHHQEGEVDITPTRASTCVPLSDDESEDELALWTHDESTAIYPVARDDVGEVEQEVIELPDSDSDEEFEAILTRPPRLTRVSPLPVPHPKEAQQPLQSPPDSDRRRSKPRTRSHFKTKSTEVMLMSEGRPRSPPVPRKPEVVLILKKRKPSVSKETATTTSNDGVSNQKVLNPISPTQKGKVKEKIPPFVEEDHREKTPKSLGVASRGRKRKRIASSSASGGPSAQSPGEPKGSLRSHGKLAPQSSTTLSRPDWSQPTLDEDVSIPVQFDCTDAGPSRSLSACPSAPQTRRPILSVPVYRSLGPESIQPSLHDHHSDMTLLSDSPTPVTHPHSQRHPSHAPSLLSSPDQGMPGLSLSAHPLPPMDPVQTQQAHYLLAQAMHQLSCLISAAMPPYAAYAPNSGQPWHPLPPHTTYSSPVHHPPYFHGTRPYHSSSSMSRSGLPPSSPVQSSMSPSVEEQHARSRGRSRSRVRRVSFKLDSGEVIGGREPNIQPELHHSGRKQPLEIKREKGEGKRREEIDNSLRAEDRGSPPQEVARGRTPGPPSRKKIGVSRGKSLGCR